MKEECSNEDNKRVRERILRVTVVDEQKTLNIFHFLTGRVWSVESKHRPRVWTYLAAHVVCLKIIAQK